MAKEVGLSQSAISRIWRAFGLKPWFVEDFKVSTDPQFIDRVHDIVRLYLNPPDWALVLCVDEKTTVPVDLHFGSSTSRKNHYERVGVNVPTSEPTRTLAWRHHSWNFSSNVHL